MRESLTVLAIALIVVLTTALVGPYFVDWNAHRGAIETRLSSLLGAKVTVGGPIDVKLLPRPIFRLGDVAVSGRSPRDPVASAARLDVELALTALLRGEFVFVEAELTRPKLDLVMGPDGGIVPPRFAATDPDHVSIGHVALREGTVRVLDGTGRTLVGVTGLTGDGEADSLAGPFRFTGQLDGATAPYAFRLNTGAIDGGRMRVKATADAQAGLPRTDIEGLVSLAEGAGGAVTPRLEGSVTASAAIPLAGSTSNIPWTLRAQVAATTPGVEVSGIELRAGADGRAMLATGSGRIDLGATPRSAFVLRARQADIPRLAVAPDGSKPADGQPSATLAALRGLVDTADPSAGLPLPVVVDYTVDAVTLGEQTLTGLNGHLAFAPGAPIAGTLAVGAADGSTLSLDGTFEPGPAAVFKGKLSTSSLNVGRLADTLAADLPDVAALLRHAAPARSAAFSGTVDLSGVGFAARDIDLRLDQSRFAGTVTLTRTVGRDRARLFADLTSDALDLDALPDWRDAAGAAADLDLALNLSARAVRLASGDTGGVSTGRVALQLTKNAEQVTLDRLALADIGGATASFSGRSDGNLAHLEGRVDARRLRDLLTVVNRVLPDTATSALLIRADSLSPALVNVAIDGAVDDRSTPHLTRLSLDGTAAGTALELHVAPQGSSRFDATLRLDAPEANALLRQLGIATLAGAVVGHGKIEADAHLDGAFRPIDGGLTAALADTVLTLRGRRGEGTALAGRMTIKGANIAPLLRAVQLAAPEPGASWATDAGADLALRDGRLAVAGIAGRALGVGFKGDLLYVVPPSDTAAAAIAEGAVAVPPALTGTLAIDRLPLPVLGALALGPLAPPKSGATWPDGPFAPGFLTLPRTEIALSVPQMPLTATATARDAAMRLQFGPGLVGLTGLTAKLGDGHLDASLALRRNGPAASLGGHVAWDGVPATTPALGGRSRGALDLAGSGNSVAALVASLAGGGTLGLDDARLPRLDAGALGRVVSETGATTTDIDDTAIRQAITQKPRPGRPVARRRDDAPSRSRPGCCAAIRSPWTALSPGR